MVSWALKKHSAWFSKLNHKYGEDLLIWLLSRGPSLTTLHQEGKTQKEISQRASCSQSAVSKHIHKKSVGRGEMWAGNAAQPREMTAALTALWRRVRFPEFGGSFKDSGLKLESRYQKPLFTDVSGKWATIAVFPWSSHFWTQDNGRSVWLGLWKRSTGQLQSGPKSSFQTKASFVCHLEVKAPESGERLERNKIQVAWNPVWSSHSQRWFGEPCQLLVLVHCVSSSPE